ncbi:MAG: phenylacetic acid degradation operon negative regulatory protein PaaX [Candidatus Eremiobacteraeota bacterium]|nr:phenylacetic acid degradation operon negative regulatory protein PaaX [Candidatus Eremiobacteraeota bacterium]MBV9056015.1 phenylacetic acid degradation operon negative regulatory protein PaaX [Candidatus Eremiobacteraeota bacterium]MBV9698597.1 phenylacetic acid degradation operon negative regulatory protein PaaX [Candidatus Eremiobacteraeota bacterium]
MTSPASAAPAEAAKRSVARPSSFIFTLYGDVVARSGGSGWLRVGALIQIMGAFGLSAPAVRQAVSRMSRQGWLRARRERARAYYAVTERGSRRIAELSPRIYGPIIEWDGRWRVLDYAIGEAHRKRRESLRKELSVLGWGVLSPSTWISPADTLEAAREAARTTETLHAVALFESVYRGPLSDRELLERCWDVQSIALAYRGFIARYAPRLEHERTTAALGDQAALVERLWLVHDYRKFAYIDPGLPSELLPAHWPGTAAASLFREYYVALETKSQRYFHLCAGEANGGSG